MIINNDKILKNGDNIFKSQVVDSYLNINTTGDVKIYMCTSEDLTPSDSISTYYQTPTAVIKETCTTGTYQNFYFSGTGEGSNKNLYFCGNLEPVICFRPYQTNYSSGCFGGDIVCLINEFPNLQTFCGGNYLTRFEQTNITSASFPRTLNTFQLCDCWISGDIGTTTGLENLKCVNWQYVKFSGNFHDIKTTSLERTHFRYTPIDFKIDLNCLTANNPNYTQSCLYYACGTELDASTVDVSNLQNICWVNRTTSAGEIQNWQFNTGLTNFCVSMCIGGDMTDFDFSDTELRNFNICDTSYGNCCLGGELSGLTFPNTIRYISIVYADCLTSIPSNYCAYDDLYYMNYQYNPALSGDVTTFIFPSGATNLTFAVYESQLSGNLENLEICSGVTSLQLRRSCFTGDIGNINYPTGLTSLYFDENCLSGNLASVPISSAVSGYINFGNNPDVYLDLTSCSFNTCNSFGLQVCNNDYVRGDLSNLTLGNNTRFLCFNGTCIESDLCNLDLNNVQSLNASCSCLCQDITSLFTGTTNMTVFCANNNPGLSGDTTNWQVDDICRMNVGFTCLSGRLCQACPYELQIIFTDISSCIEEDFDFSDRSYNIDMYGSCIQGHLSGVTLNYSGLYRFAVYSNPNLFGSNAFVDNIFVNRKNFGRSYVSLAFQGIGDSVSGTSETLGDLGTYTGDANDLTEAEVNNLVDGTDYDGNGSNTPWDNKNKIWWVKNALVSSSSTSKRYGNFQISYS